MVSRCANPECTAQFRYLSRGRLFHLCSRMRQGQSAFRSESYWLCDACALHLTIAARSDGTVAVQRIVNDNFAPDASQAIAAVT